MFGDPPFFGQSPFHTPPAPAPNYGGQYVSGPNHSGFQFHGGPMSGYQVWTYQGLVYVDRDHRIS